MIDGRLKHLSKNKEERIQQLNLLIHNCNIYGVKESTKKIFMSELFKIENMSNEIYEEYINNVMQVWINELILSGKTYTHSDGTKAEYKEISKMCECNTK